MSYLPHIIKVFCFTFFYSLIWIWQGFDVSDEGVNLTWQWLMSINAKEAPYDYMWLSNAVGGFWLNIFPSLGIIWARLGWTLLISLISVTSFLIIAPNIGPKQAVNAAIITSLILLHWMVFLIDYNTLPTFILLLSIASILKAYRCHNVYFFCFGRFVQVY